MGAPRAIPFPPYQISGLDHRGSDLTRPPQVATVCRNIDHLSLSDDGTARPGSKIVGDNAGAGGGFGCWSFSDGSSTTIERLIAGISLYRQKAGSLNITYVGAGSGILVSVVPVSGGTYKCVLNVDGADVFTMSLGSGFDVVSPVTVDDLRAAIDALADFSATVTGSTTVPAAFLALTVEQAFSAGAYAVPFLYNEKVTQPTGAPNPFAGLNAYRNAESFELISSIERQGCRYFATMYDEMQKYDGRCIYRAGAPEAVLTSVVSVGAGSVGSGSWPDVYQHLVTFVQYDAQGNRTEGMPSNIASTSIGALSNFTVTFPPVQPSTGFLTDCAMAVGAQVGVNTINVDNGAGGAHSLQVGQTAYFYDGASAAYVERAITARTNSTITVSGAVVNVSDNTPISANLRVAIYRTPADGDVFQLVDEIPNNSCLASQVYTDSKTDATLGEYYDDPAELAAEHKVPPKFKYLASFRGLTIGIRLANDNSGFVFSDVDSAEYWPDANKSFARGTINRPLVGGAENGQALWLFTANSYFTVTGDLTSGQFAVDLISERVGLKAHSALVRHGTALMWPSAYSFFVSDNGTAPIDFGSPIWRLFRKQQNPEAQLKWLRACAISDGKSDRVFWFVPAESTTSGDVHCNSHSLVICYDAYRQKWKEFDSLNMGGGVSMDDEKMWWVAKRYSSVNLAMDYFVWERLQTDTVYDCQDHALPILGEYQNGWEHYSAPSVLKDFTCMKLYALNPDYAPNFDLNVRTELDFQEGVSSTLSTLSFGADSSTGFSAGSWGISAFGDPLANRINRLPLKAQSAKALRCNFSFSAFCQRVVLSGWEIETAQSYSNEMRT